MRKHAQGVGSHDGDGRVGRGGLLRLDEVKVAPRHHVTRHGLWQSARKERTHGRTGKVPKSRGRTHTQPQKRGRGKYCKRHRTSVRRLLIRSTTSKL